MKEKKNKSTYIFGIWTLSASFCRPKSCHGRDLEDGWLPKDVVGLFCPPWTTLRCKLFTETGIVPELSNNADGWHSSV